MPDKHPRDGMVAKMLRRSSYLAVSTQNQHIGKRLLSYLRSLTVLMIMSNAFSGIFFFQVICAVKYSVLGNVRVLCFQWVLFFI